MDVLMLRSILIFTVGSCLQIGSVSAAVVQVDGVMDSNDTYTKAITANWINAHKTEFSIYDDWSDTTTVWYTTDTDYLYLYIEAPLYAKNMVWGTGCDAACTAEYSDQYGTHHNDALVMDYAGATGSEAADFEVITGVNFNGSYLGKSQGKKDSSKGKKNHSKGKKNSLKSKNNPLKGKKNPSKAGTGVALYASSHDWLLDNGCDTTNCAASTVEMSFEFALDRNVVDEDDIIASIQTPAHGIVFHLSPERRASAVPISPDPISAVPVPAAAWLFGSALGLLGWMRRKSS
jgi:hypothetical protein